MRLRLKLMPLLRLEDVLARRLTDTDVVRRGKAGLGDGVGKEVEINSNVRWKDLFSRYVGYLTADSPVDVHHGQLQVCRQSRLLSLFGGR